MEKKIQIFWNWSLSHLFSKRVDVLQKNYYRLVNIHPVFSKIIEKFQLNQSQLLVFDDKILSNFQYGFGKSTAQIMKFSIKDLFSKCDQICKSAFLCSECRVCKTAYWRCLRWKMALAKTNNFQRFDGLCYLIC